MKKRIARRLFAVMSVSLVLLLLASCSTKNLEVDLLIYMQEDEETAGAYELGINLTEGTLTRATEPLYQVQKNAEMENFDRDTIYPRCLNDEIMVLGEEPLQVFQTPYEIAEPSETKEYRKDSEIEGEFISFKQIWNGDECLDYTADEKWESCEVKKAGETIGVLTMEVKGIERFEPLAFFLDQDRTLALICKRTNGSTALESYPVSIVAEKKDDGTFEVVQKHSFRGMFGEELSWHSPPYSDDSGANIYGDAKAGCFYWNESYNIVKMNPYDGSFQIAVQVPDIERDIPTLDTTRESYDFFWSFGRQNGINILVFPNYNDTKGMIAAFYDDEGSYLGRVLVSEDTVTLFNRKNEESAGIEDPGLLGFFLYAPFKP